MERAIIGVGNPGDSLEAHGRDKNVPPRSVESGSFARVADTELKEGPRLDMAGCHWPIRARLRRTLAMIRLTMVTFY